MRRQSGFSLIELLIVVSIILIVAAIAIPNLLRAKIAANESSAAASVRTLISADVSYSIAFPAAGFPAALSNLGPNGTNCSNGPTSTNACIIDITLAGGTKSGYAITDVGSNKINGAFTQFVISATPVTINTTGVKGFCAVQDGVVRWLSPASGGIAYANCTGLGALK